MIRAVWITGILMAITLNLFAQSKDCPDCPCVLRQAEKMVSEQYYDQAIRLFNAYKVCAPASERAKTDKRILEVFNLIEQQRDNAIAAQREADRQKRRANRAFEDADTQRKQAERLARASSNALKALQIEKKDPTLALRLAEANFNLFPESKAASGIFSGMISNSGEGKSELIINQGRDAYITDLACTPDGKYILAGSRDGIARLWDLDGTLVRTLEGHTAEITSVDISPDGRHYLTSSYDGTSRLWDAQSEAVRLIDSIQGVDFIVTSNNRRIAAFSPICSSEGYCNAFISSNHTVTIKDILQEEGPTTLIEEEEPINAAMFTPDGQGIITCAANHATIWDLKGNALSSLHGHSSVITDMDIIPDCPPAIDCAFPRPALLTTSADKTTRLWDLEGNLLQVFRGSSSGLQSVIYHQGSIITGGEDGVIRQWNLQGNELRKFRGHADFVNALTPIPGTYKFASGSKDGSIRVWDSNGQLLNSQVFDFDIQTADFFPNGQYWLLSQQIGSIGIDNIERQVLLGIGKYSSLISALDIAPDGTNFAVGYDRGTIVVYNPYGEVIHKFKAHESISSLAYTHYGQYIVSSAEEGDAAIWQLDGQRVAELKGHQHPVTGIASTLDGSCIVTLSETGTVCVWAKDGVLRRTIELPATYNTTIGLSPDEQNIGVGGQDGKFLLIDFDGKEQLNIQAHTDAINDLAFTPDGLHIITASASGTAKIWDWNEQEVQYLEDDGGGIHTVSASPDGRYILTSSADASVKLWLNTAVYLAERVQQYPLEQLQSAGLEYTPADLLQQQKRQADRLAHAKARFLQVKKRSNEEAGLSYVYALIHLHQIAGQQNEQFSFQQFKILERPEELSTAGFYFYRNGLLDEAKQLLQQAIQKGAGMDVLIYLHKIARLQHQDFDIQLMLKQTEPGALQLGANYLENIEAWEEAEQLYEQIIRLKASIPLKYRLYQISKKTGKDRFDELFLKAELSGLRESVDYFNQLLSIDDTPKEKRDIYELLHRLGLRIMKLNSSENNLLEYANYTNSYAWSQLLTGDFAGAEQTVRTGLKYAPDYEYFHTNLPLSLLLQGKYEEAVELYKQYKDKEWTINDRYTYFRSAFLDDLEEFEERGILTDEHRPAVRWVTETILKKIK